jgi:hypothetical protein
MGRRGNRVCAGSPGATTGRWLDSVTTSQSVLMPNVDAKMAKHHPSTAWRQRRRCSMANLCSTCVLLRPCRSGYLPVEGRRLARTTNQDFGVCKARILPTTRKQPSPSQRHTCMPRPRHLPC